MKKYHIVSQENKYIKWLGIYSPFDITVSENLFRVLSSEMDIAVLSIENDYDNEESPDIIISMLSQGQSASGFNIRDYMKEGESPTDLSKLDNIKKYDGYELTTLTKEEMKNILIERGYLGRHKYAPRYHDSVAQLMEKILKTQ